jgi:hypothetical protein
MGRNCFIAVKERFYTTISGKALREIGARYYQFGTRRFGLLFSLALWNNQRLARLRGLVEWLVVLPEGWSEGENSTNYPSPKPSPNGSGSLFGASLGNVLLTTMYGIGKK